MTAENMPRCATCKYWGKQPPHGQWVNTDRVCGRIYENEENGMAGGDIAVTFNHHGDDSGLKTEADFGCILHEPK